MTDSTVKAPIRLDLRVAMGDPEGSSTMFLPDDVELRKRLATRDVALADYWHLRALRRYYERDFQSAVEMLNIALLHDAGRGESHFLKGVCLQLLAIQAADTYPGFPEHMPPRAHTLLMKARWALQIAQEINPDDEEARTYIQGLEALLR